MKRKIPQYYISFVLLGFVTEKSEFMTICLNKVKYEVVNKINRFGIGIFFKLGSIVLQ